MNTRSEYWCGREHWCGRDLDSVVEVSDGRKRQELVGVWEGKVGRAVSTPNFDEKSRR